MKNNVYKKEKERAVIVLTNGLKFEYDRIIKVDEPDYNEDFGTITVEKREGRKLITEELTIREDQIAFISQTKRKNELKAKYKVIEWVYRKWIRYKRNKRMLMMERDERRKNGEI